MRSNVISFLVLDKMMGPSRRARDKNAEKLTLESREEQATASNRREVDAE